MLATETVVHCEWFPTDAGRRKTRGLPIIPKTQSIPEIGLVEMEVLVLYGNDSNPAGGSFFTGTVHLFLKISWQFCTERLGSILCFSRFFLLCSLINSSWSHWISPAESFDSPSIACTKGDVILMDAVYCDTEREHGFYNPRPPSCDGKASRFLS